MPDDREWLGTDLCVALHALSLDGDEALAMQEPNERRAAQLALGFGNAILNLITEQPPPVSQSLLNGLSELAATLNGMSNGSPDLWTDDAVRHDPAWVKVRTLARKALTDLGVQRDGVRMN
jgi:hypothetical protein